VLEGEMAELDVASREAEEIAGIADNLLVPPATQAFIEASAVPVIASRALRPEGRRLQSA
jgi:hypothetical protein